jgi:hypothetical protein
MRCACLTCGPHKSRYSDKQIEEARRKLARLWRQKIDQILEEEAEWFLDRNCHEESARLDNG